MSTNPANPAAPEPTRPDQGGDPSMEDILASIRRILNEEEPRLAPTPDVLELTPAMRADPPADVPAPPAPEPVAQPMLPLRRDIPPEPEMAVAPPPPEPVPEPAPAVVPPPVVVTPAFVHLPEPTPEAPTVIFTPVITPAPVATAAPDEEPPVMAPPAPVPAPPRTETKAPEPPVSLVAPAAAAAAAASMGELVRRLAGSQSVPVRSGGPTIEDIVREEIRGLLKAWLDENLPRVVERLVQAEIERVVSRHVG
jgi:cell pole-organizing protein PopZ